MIGNANPLDTAPGPAAFSAQSPAARLYDFTAHPRLALRGPGSAAWLAEQGWAMPRALNTATTTATGHTLLRLGKTEAWVLAGQGAPNPVQQAHRQLHQGEGLYPLYAQHSHAWFVLAGPQRAAIMATLCAVDMSEAAFPVGAVAQTSVARLSAVVAHHPWAEAAVFSLLVDRSYAAYFYTAVADALAQG